MEALEIVIQGPSPLGVSYRAHVAQNGWLPWVKEGGTAGTTGESRRMEAARISLHAPWTPDGTYDVGVIPDGGVCPPTSERVVIYMDDEDKNNANGTSGWHGSINNQGNTQFVFCRVNGTLFHHYESLVSFSVASYAVLQLGASCPPGSTGFQRYFDNEDKNNKNSFSGHIFPNSVFPRDTWLHFCSFPRDTWRNNTVMNFFPDLGISYGVLGSTNLEGFAHGTLVIDDEDSQNQNDILGPFFAYETLVEPISQPFGTRINLTRVK